MAEIRFNGVEIGFGSPTFSGDAPPRDAGFGAPWPLAVNSNDYINIAETGHGDPFLKPSISIETPPGIPPNYKKLADNGGEIIRIHGDFSSIRNLISRAGNNATPGNPLGPFQLKFILLDENDELTDTYFLGQSSIPNLRHRCFTNSQQDELLVTTPVMPKGNYRLQLQPIVNGFGIYKPIELEDFEVITRLRFDKTMSLRHNLPSFWDAGERTDAYDASKGYIKGQDSNWSYLLQAVGEGLQNLYNNSYTIITQDWNKGDDRLYIETSLGLNPAGGRIIIGNGEYEYEAVGRGTDRNIHFLTGLKKLVRTSGKGPRQHDLENPKIYAGDDQIPPHEDAVLTDSIENPIIYKGTRLHTDHFDFSVIENFYKLLNTGFVKPELVSQTQWERAFNRIEYGERELTRVIFEYFYEIFKKLNLPVRLKGNDVEFRVFPNELGAADRWAVGLAYNDTSYQPNVGVIYDYGNNSLNCSHVQRLCRINKKFYFIKNRFIDNNGNGNYQLDSYGCTYWNGMDEETAELFENSNVNDVEIEILPWIIFRDQDGKFHIRFERTCFKGIDSFIDRNFIQFDMFISALNGEEDVSNDTNRGFNFMEMLAANIDDKIYLYQRCNSVFGTYFNPQIAPAEEIYVEPQRNLL